jgi:hypothetical protein
VSDAEQPHGGGGEDLSVPMWVWTLLGFAAVIAVIVIVIIVGSRNAPDQQQPGEGDVPASTESLDADTQPAGTQPATAP